MLELKVYQKTSSHSWFNLAQDKVRTLSIKRHGVHHSISHGLRFSVNKNQQNAVVTVSPKLTLN